ncbi:MAG TPA: cytochrome c3 family protein, partial [Symbiobacteriaceae bacterium]|nr:cytochrome c3 family protein [Symbiobacteriaceae bacterium]
MRKYALRFIPVLALVAAVTAGIIWMQSAGAASSASNTPPLMACGSCHSMEKEVSSWKTSEHAGVSCLECHQEGDVGWVSHEFADRNDDMASIAKAYTIHLKVPNERCTECHKSQMDSIMKDIVPKPIKAAVSSVPAGQPMPVKAAHELHVNGNPQLKCVDCHLPAVHGLQKGTVERQNLIHQQCQTCHQEKQVTFTVAGSFSCSACHTNAADVTPANHKNTALWQ